MSGKIFVISSGLFTFAFACCLYYFQVFAYYEESEPLSYLMVGTRTIPVTNYRGIDSSSSGLKLRGCFEVNPSDFVGLPKPEKATPLSAPFWFRCFDHKILQNAIDNEKVNVYLLVKNEKDGIDRIAAVFDSGKAFQWRQLNTKFQD
ncbi:MAG: DUF6446 family protein [Pseudomonadota bacterium]|nr:DUF6446 family protein [Pseudomonadota bacterium]